MKENLTRFHTAQENCYFTVINEIKNGKKTSHWMWFTFPQIAGLGKSLTSKKYEIANLSEASEFLRDELLAERLIELTEILLAHDDTITAKDIFGFTDSRKFHSCMTLFFVVVCHSKEFENKARFQCFENALTKFFGGRCDNHTLGILQYRDLRNRTVATASSWDITPIKQPAPLEIHFQFTVQEYSLLIRGLIPRDMDERWFIYYDNGWLYLHRSWSGIGIYKAQIISTGKEHTINTFWVERDNFENTPERDAYDRETFTLLIDMLLQKMVFDY